MKQLSLLDGLDDREAPGQAAGTSASLASDGQVPPLASKDETAAIPPAMLPVIPPATPTPEIRRLADALADALDNGLYLGTSSWSFPGWSGLIYGVPTGKANLAQHGLPAYAEHPLLRSVGVDSGFYAPLDQLCEPDPESRAQLARAVLNARAQQRPVFVIVNNKAEGSAPLSLIELVRRLLPTE